MCIVTFYCYNTFYLKILIVTFCPRGFFNSKTINCDFLSYQNCDFMSCDFLSVYRNISPSK